MAKEDAFRDGKQRRKRQQTRKQKAAPTARRRRRLPLAEEERLYQYILFLSRRRTSGLTRKDLRIVRTRLVEAGTKVRILDLEANAERLERQQARQRSERLTAFFSRTSL